MPVHLVGFEHLTMTELEDMVSCLRGWTTWSWGSLCGKYTCFSTMNMQRRLCPLSRIQDAELIDQHDICDMIKKDEILVSEVIELMEDEIERRGIQIDN